MSPPDPWGRLPSVVEAVAYHEAGHAVASWRLGDGIRKVTIAPSSNASGTEAYDGTFTPGKIADRTLASGWIFRHLVMLLAGPAAQHLHDPRSDSLAGAVYDLRDARLFALLKSSTREAASALLVWAETEAQGRVSSDWGLISALARELIAVTNLTGEAAVALLEEAERSRRRAAAAMRASLTNFDEA